MCGIAGIVSFNGSEPSHEQLKRMTDIIMHRGPDDSGFFSEAGIGLGFRRLSIIDLAEGHQPISNEDDSIWLIFNGEIYNYKALREMLVQKGHRFKTHTDTEVVLHMYEEYGEECVKHFRGMFGFALWDKKTRKLFAARDHFGIKPFYYTAGSRHFVFGSEIKSILASHLVTKEVDTQSLYHYLTFQYVPEPRTMFAGIFKLPPAHTLTVDSEGKISLNKYWDPMFEPERRPIGEYIEQIRATLSDSVKHHMQSDVQRGSFLSSGIDSTAISAQMRAIEPIKTFSVGFAGPNDETPIAQQSANALNTEHYAKIITEEDYFATVPKAIWHQDEPVADPSAIALYHVAQLAREHVTVVLSGEGADEIFGGYRIYNEPLSLRPLNWLPLPLKRVLHKVIAGIPMNFYGKNYLLRGMTPLEQRFLGNARIFSESMKQELLKLHNHNTVALEDAVSAAKPFYEKSAHLDAVTRMQYIDLNLWMPGDILMKADKMTMAHSLELRVPFLDKELFELVRRIPADYRIAGGTTKYIFRRAMEGIVPEFVLQRPKLGFPVPMRDWLKGGRGDAILQQIQASGVERYFRMDHIRDMLQMHRAGKGDYSRHLWVLYVFSLWHATYMQPQSSHALSAI